MYLVGVLRQDMRFRACGASSGVRCRRTHKSPWCLVGNGERHYKDCCRGHSIHMDYQSECFPSFPATHLVEMSAEKNWWQVGLTWCPRQLR